MPCSTGYPGSYQAGLGWPQSNGDPVALESQVLGLQEQAPSWLQTEFLTTNQNNSGGSPLCGHRETQTKELHRLWNGSHTTLAQVIEKC